MSLRGRLTSMRSIVVTCLGVGLLAVATPRTARADELKIGDRLSELDGAVDANGKAFRVKAQKGKWLMLTFGASWCGPCAKELPAWDKLAPSWKDKVEFVAVDLDEKIDAGKDFHNKVKLKNLSRVYLSPESAVAAKYGSDHMPTTVLADPQGVIRYIRGGFEKGDVDGEVDKMKAQLSKLVK